MRYIQGQINEIRNSVENRKSRLSWHTINEVSKRKNTLREKLKAVNQEKRLQKWKEHFKSMQGNLRKITYNPTKKLIG